MDGLPGGARRCVLLAAAGARWEPDALGVLTAAGVVVLKRCVDLPDLLATAAAGQADAAVLGPDLAGLDADVVRQLRATGVAPVAVADAAGDHAALLDRLGVGRVADPSGLPAAIDAALAAGPAPGERPAPPGDSPGPADEPGRAGRRVAVWGPAGAPGRTTVATALAAERAHAGRPVRLLDVDPYGGTVAQGLGVLDEVSGLLAAARLAGDGSLDSEGLRACRRTVGDRLEVLTGLPRPDRWTEVRAGVVASVLELSALDGDVVADCGFCLEERDGGFGPGRNAMTLEAVTDADEVVLVGTAEPAGLARLARALVDLAEVAGTPTRVVVNRMRDSLGWRREDVVGMIEGYAGAVPVHFWPEDRAGLDRALVTGRTLPELGDSPLRESARALVAEVFPDGSPRRGTGRGRRRRRH